jgi:nucleotide-binding universal stress UspA family protein
MTTRQPGTPTNIVVGVTKQATALEACKRAFELARATDAIVHLVYALTESDPKAEAVARNQSEGLLESLRMSSSLPMTVHVEFGAPHDVILEVAERVHADLIVIGNQGLVSHGRFTRLTPAKVLRGAKCSVLVVDTSDAIAH